MHSGTDQKAYFRRNFSRLLGFSVLLTGKPVFILSWFPNDFCAEFLEISYRHTQKMLVYLSSLITNWPCVCYYLKQTDMVLFCIFRAWHLRGEAQALYVMITHSSFCVYLLISVLKERSAERVRAPQWTCSGQPRRVGDRWGKDNVSWGLLAMLRRAPKSSIPGMYCVSSELLTAESESRGLPTRACHQECLAPT